MRVEARGISRTAATVEDDAGLDGRVYLVELATRKGTIVALDAQWPGDRAHLARVIAVA